MEISRPSSSPLVSGGHAPHMMKMTPIENPQNDASQHVAAIARWEDEGGAFKSSATNRRGSIKSNTGTSADGRASQKVDQAFAAQSAP